LSSWNVLPELNAAEARVLGALIEKDLATPEYYPLSLHALVSACNQKTNREPIVSFDESIAMEALEGLRTRGWAAFVHEAGSRVEKYRHKLGEAFNFTRGELALMGVLLLRGPQTVAELRERTARLFPFDDNESVEHCLEKLATREPDPLARLLPKQPGTKEPRWTHLLCGEPQWTSAEPVPAMVMAPPARTPLDTRVEKLEAEVQVLREEFERFRRQFE
jgi:uncharacterized protein YceH (UPF0502 family)